MIELNLPRATDPDDGHELVDAYGLPLYQESDLHVPAEVATNMPFGNAGVLIRNDLPGQNSELWRDVFRRSIIEQSDWAKWIKEGIGNRRRYMTRTFNQGSSSSCAADGVHHNLMSIRAMRGMKDVLLNPWPAYYEACGGIDRGSYLVDNLNIIRGVGAVPDELWPRTQHPWNDVPPASHEATKARKKYRIDEYYEIISAVEAASALFADHAVYAAYEGHAWELAGVLSTQQALWHNSLGEGWGDNGFGVINWTTITFQYGLFAIETCVIED